jgi:two-component system, sensor histidine kinase and response regulator
MREKILLVDDQPKNIQVAGTLLTTNGFEVEFATDGFKALEWLKDGVFDLVLLDVMMPGMDGFETCRRFKQMHGSEDVPVIFLTAKTDTESIVEGFTAGGVDYLTKPFQGEELLVRVRTHLELKQMRAKLKDVNMWLQSEVDKKTQELQEMNKALQTSLSKLETLDKSKDNFLKIISHEIRTPLNGIIGASFLLRSMITTPDQQEFFDMLDVSLKRLETFSFAALQITELQAKANNLPHSPETISSLIDEAKLITHIGQQRTFVVEAGDLPETIAVNKVLMVTALVKLLDNAIRFSPQGSKVTIQVTPENGELRFRIIDEGSGFPEAVLLRKFEPFITGETHVDKNPGLSLPLVKFIIESHGGRIDLYNNPAGGAVVEFYIPF